MTGVRARDELGVTLGSPAVSGVHVVNLVGPLGVGKSTILADLSAEFGVPVHDLSRGGVATGQGDLVLLDGADSTDSVDAVVTALGAAEPGTRVVVAGRLPLRSRPSWPVDGRWTVDTVTVDAWDPSDIDGLVRARGVTEPAAVDLAVRLSGGIPLIADRIARALHGGTSAELPGAVGHAAAVEVLDRLRREDLGVTDEVLLTLAVLGAADEELLATVAHDPAHDPASDSATDSAFDRVFDALTRCSIVRAEPHGPAVVEPYRTLLDLHHRWRRPLNHHAVLAKGVRHRHRQIRITRDARARVRLIEHALFLTDDPELRAVLVPPRDQPGEVRAARPGDEEVIARLMALWARRGNLNPRVCGRLLDLWLETSLPSFHLAVARDGRTIGMSNLMPIDATTMPALEPLLQQHLTSLGRPGDGDGRAGVVVGMAFTDDRNPLARAMIMGNVLRTGVATGRLVISTHWTPYQHLAARFGLAHVGATRHDIYRCGRPSEIYDRAFSEEGLPDWLRQFDIGGEPDPSGGAHRLDGLVRQALNALHDPVALARSPLLATPSITSADDLAATLRHGIEALAASSSRPDAQAGQAMVETYLRTDAERATAAQRLHLSRATYYRRLQHGVNRLAEAMLVTARTWR